MIHNLLPIVCSELNDYFKSRYGLREDRLVLSNLIELSNKLNDMMKTNQNPKLLDETRPSDQIIYISDITEVSKDFNWKPALNIEKGLSSVISWLDNDDLEWVG